MGTIQIKDTQFKCFENEKDVKDYLFGRSGSSGTEWHRDATKTQSINQQSANRHWCSCDMTVMTAKMSLHFEKTDAEKYLDEALKGDGFEPAETHGMDAPKWKSLEPSGECAAAFHQRPVFRSLHVYQKRESQSRRLFRFDDIDYTIFMEDLF